MHDCVDSGCEQCMHCRTIHARGQSQGLDARWQILGRIRVHGATPTFVPGVQGHEQIDYLRASHLPDHNAIGPHP